MSQLLSQVGHSTGASVTTIRPFNEQSGLASLGWTPLISMIRVTCMFFLTACRVLKAGGGCGSVGKQKTGLESPKQPPEGHGLI